MVNIQSQEKIVVKTLTGNYQYLVMTFGPTNILAVFQTLVNDVPQHVIDKYALSPGNMERDHMKMPIAPVWPRVENRNELQHLLGFCQFLLALRQRHWYSAAQTDIIQKQRLPGT